MNRIFVLIFSTLLSLGVSISADGKERVVPFNYELSVVQEGNSATSGHKIFKVWSFGKKSDLTDKICMRNAIHGILFRGLTSRLFRRFLRQRRLSPVHTACQQGSTAGGRCGEDEERL